MAQQSTASAQRGPTSGVHQAAKPTPKPLLASEALREELAPAEPARSSARWWLLGTSAVLALVGLAMRFGAGLPEVRADGATIAFSAAGATAAVAVLPFPYALRAGMALILGTALMALGLRAAGPLAGLGADGGELRDLARLMVLATLPPALLFRSSYRAYPTARWILAVALVVCAPFVVISVALALDPSAAMALRAASVFSVIAITCSLTGFMGAGTTAGTGVWAALVSVALPLEIALKQLTPVADGSGWLTYPVTALGVSCAGVLTALGVYQLLAAALCRDAARRVQTVRAGASDGSSTA